jgi:hypothetical protein
MKHYGKLTAWITAAWFIFVLCASALHLFQNESNRIGFAVAVSALTPIVVFALWFACSESFRNFALHWTCAL